MGIVEAVNTFVITQLQGAVYSIISGLGNLTKMPSNSYMNFHFKKSVNHVE